MSNQLILTLLLNACWQIPLVAIWASIGSWLLRHSATRYRHWLWVSALLLAFLIPTITSLRVVVDNFPSTDVVQETGMERDLVHPVMTDRQVSKSSAVLPAGDSAFQLNRNLAFALLLTYFAFLFYRSLKLLQAWQATRTIRRRAVEFESNAGITEAFTKCQNAVATRRGRVQILRSVNVPVPITIGLLRPIIILPGPLVDDGNIELLTSAIGHELIHVARRDYLLNFIYELLYLPLAFHPAAALIRRRINQTRELCCDELVAERILNAEVYARSLVKLASSAPPLRRLSVTTTVGIADADILEARIMSLLRKPKLNTRWKKLLLIAVSILLVVPCIAAVSFAMRFDVGSAANLDAQDPSQQEKERADKEMTEARKRGSEEAEQVMKERMASDPQFRAEVMRKHAMEMEMREVRQAALVRLAKVSMEQAIQIATSQQPGKVLECTLIGERWEEPGKLAKDGQVLYHVMIADEVNPGATHVLVNAVDGTIFKTEKELPRRMRSPEER
jgi:bla regulator protein blaR1